MKKKTPKRGREIITNKKTPDWAIFTVSLVTLYYMIYSSMARAGFSLFACQSFGLGGSLSTTRLQNALDFECYSGNHLQWVFYLGIPFCTCVIIGLPLTAFVILYRNRNDLMTNTSLLQKYGFLFRGYQAKFWYWECVILLRKVSIAALTVFLSLHSEYTQGLSALFILNTSLIVQLVFSPYDQSNLNNLEVFGLVCSVATVYFGMWTFDLDDSSSSSSSSSSSMNSTNYSDMRILVSSLLIYIINGLWFSVVCYYMFDGYSSKVKKLCCKKRK